ncbi:hypothetical protein SODALDRAFT_122468 [Sodiomyces alkalinus F11]|uniref:Uncharacterized protein n=1 Tax=Sodiomyces alkalinus (strain CBS 110278 / VKM F-3762 / F11) TaxID=1314773 RepID=A0A3N2Q471_SODAK|nr:hypothetical protein SODALDRAFT_122468 [Sodiomyces alkalinus F11]ROT41553.1 hypothetical protein SODALDRAFT_122468 [Sodiomyces alkalinus F11]
MTSDTQSPRTSTSSRRRIPNHDTGFPEPFNGVSNTTLPHPEANISPDAVISQEDIIFSKKGRSSRSFRQKHKRTISHGRITQQMQAMYSDVVLEEDEDMLEPPMSPISTMDFEASLQSRRTSSNPPQTPPEISLRTGHMSRGKDGDSLLSHSAGETSPTSSERSYKRSLLRRLGLRRKV